MIPDKRIILIAGHYGSGKTNVAVNLALELNKRVEKLAVADLDIVNPYFRSKDSQEELKALGIRLICSEYANTNVDIPALPADMYTIIDDKRLHTIIDVGGDDRGALALGRLAPAIREENDYAMLLVINAYRPLTRTPEDVLEVLREIEVAGGIPVTGLINNSNLGVQTTADDVIRSVEYAQKTAKLTGLPLVMTTVEETLYPALYETIPDLFPLRLQRRVV